MNAYLVIDIGMKQGRHVVGWLQDGQLHTEEVYRFSHEAKWEGEHWVWNLSLLKEQLLQGVKEAFCRYPSLDGLMVTAWDKDYVLLQGDIEKLPVFASFDERSRILPPELHARIAFSELYRRCGQAFQYNNTIYQLCVDHKKERFNGVSDLLLIADYLSYCLCGVKSQEYSNAMSSGMVRVDSGEFDDDIIAQIRLPKALFRPLQRPGSCLSASLLPSVQEAVGGSCPVLLGISNRRAAMVEVLPKGEPQPYLLLDEGSCWLGVKQKEALLDEASRKGDFSNAAACDGFRYEKELADWGKQSVEERAAACLSALQELEENCQRQYESLYMLGDVSPELLEALRKQSGKTLLSLSADAALGNLLFALSEK